VVIKSGIAIASAALLSVFGFATLRFTSHFQERIHRVPVSSGRLLSPVGTTTAVGSFPCNMATSPDGKFVAVTDAGSRESLTILDAQTGKVIQVVPYDGKDSNGHDAGLYYGVRYIKSRGNLYLLVSTGVNESVLEFMVAADGTLGSPGASFAVGDKAIPAPIAGVDYDSKTHEIVAAINGETEVKPYNGEVIFANDISGEIDKKIEVPGFPLDVLCVKDATFVSCERDGVVVMIKDGEVVQTSRTGMNPTKLLASADEKLVYVANSGSDSVSVLDAISGRVKRTILVRPPAMHGLPGATPLGLAFGATSNELLVTLGDLNAVAVIDLKKGQVDGMIPVGWYPTAVSLNPGSMTMLVANAKGTAAHTPNSKKMGPDGKWGHYILNILEGNVSVIDLYQAESSLPQLTQQVLTNARLLSNNMDADFKNPGIKHVIYIIKENRTYDQVFGDISSGNGDASICLFGQNVSPNEHALAERFTLLDNFYTCSDVSADGWNWSTSGMINEYVARNVPNSYSGRRDGYDYEGQVGNLSPSLIGIPNVAESPGGYLWDDALKSGLSLRNYGFYLQAVNGKNPKINAEGQKADQKDLVNLTDPNYREFDLDYPDSDLWVKMGFSSPKQMKAFGPEKDACRFDAWKHEFDKYAVNGNLPALTLVRLPDDHTAGTATGNFTPSAMVADNDYALGEIVDAVSHSKFWNSTLICVLEDDSQDGYDHVDCHRSTALVISPYMQNNRHDSRFYNTDSMLRTIELMLGMKAMNSYDSTAAPIAGFQSTLVNASPFDAIMPSREIASAINGAKAYKAKLSNKIVDRFSEHSYEDILLNDVLWGSVKGPKLAPPAIIGLPPAAQRARDDD